MSTGTTGTGGELGKNKRRTRLGLGVKKFDNLASPKRLGTINRDFLNSPHSNNNNCMNPPDVQAAKCRGNAAVVANNTIKRGGEPRGSLCTPVLHTPPIFARAAQIFHGMVDMFAEPPAKNGQISSEIAQNSNQQLIIGEMSSGDAWRAQRTAKRYLARRTLDNYEHLVAKLDKRKEWNKWRKTETLLDLFTSVKYAYSSLVPASCNKGYTSFVTNGGKGGRVANIARSYSIRLDPVEAPKILYKYRLRIDRILDWAYKNSLLPVMMTLTVFHRWHDLEPLCRVLQYSWTDLFSGVSQGRRRAEHIDLQGFIRRMEETINDGDANSHNAGWHPHFHVILLIPRDKLEVLSDYEEELKIAWVALMRQNFRKVFGEEIPDAYLPSLMEHGLVISRYSRGELAGQIRRVHDSKYLAKIMGYDPSEIYGGDKEMSSCNLKSSKTPFSLLLEDTATNTDLWCEYAIATKGIPSVSFSYGLQKKVDDYFNTHKNDPVNLYGGTNVTKDNVIAYIDNETYKFLYQNFLIEDTLKIIPQGYAALEEWFQTLRETYGELPGLGIWKPPDEIDDDELVTDDKEETVEENEEDLIEVKDKLSPEMMSDIYYSTNAEVKNDLGEFLGLPSEPPPELEPPQEFNELETSLSLPPTPTESTQPQKTLNGLKMRKISRSQMQNQSEQKIVRHLVHNDVLLPEPLIKSSAKDTDAKDIVESVDLLETYGHLDLKKDLPKKASEAIPDRKWTREELAMICGEKAAGVNKPFERVLNSAQPITADKRPEEQLPKKPALPKSSPTNFAPITEKNLTRKELSIKCAELVTAIGKKVEEDKKARQEAIAAELKQQENFKAEKLAALNNVNAPNPTSQRELDVALKLDRQVFSLYGQKVSPLVAQGMSIKDAIEHLEVSPETKETILMLARCLWKNSLD